MKKKCMKKIRNRGVKVIEEKMFIKKIKAEVLCCNQCGSPDFVEKTIKQSHWENRKSGLFCKKCEIPFDMRTAKNITKTIVFL